MRVDKGSPESCWLWTGGLSDTGYGSFKDDQKRSMGAHRFSYQLHYDSIAEGMHVMHSCDTPACVNPHHLSLGTRQDNMRDMLAKGRGRPGGRQFNPKEAA
ncbi:HNH endonuclease signature motif containing protein [Streptomyces sp. NPDC005406]|uniref:HNH endonuclease signature motif containing protein n=1 Tax=Streptomyces sp. NPDC005406 TaxID=3155339 RepID=UPI0034542B8E